MEDNIILVKENPVLAKNITIMVASYTRKAETDTGRERNNSTSSYLPFKIHIAVSIILSTPFNESALVIRTGI